MCRVGLRSVIVGLGVAFAFLLARETAAQPKSEVRFLLVPKAEFVPGQTRPESLVADGEVRLYRAGEYKPRLLVKVNEWLLVPPGPWFWIGEARGGVTTEIGVLVVPEESQPPITRTLVGLLVPACAVTLGPSPLWQGTDRVDFVSLDRGVTYPLPLDFRSSLNIPAGRWLAYSVGPRGLIGITKVRTCAAGQDLHLKTIPPPGPEREEWMVHVELPDEPKVAQEDLQVALRSPLRTGAPPITAGAVLWNGRRGTFFLHDVPSGSERRLTISHPALRTVEKDQTIVGGRALEFGPLGLEPRRELVVSVDYQPARPHRDQKLVLVDCGHRPLALADQLSPSCTERNRTEVPLRPGFQEYRFPRLDDGQYRLDAEVDSEKVWGLGEGLVPLLATDDDDPPLPLKATLKEFHVYGHLLENGEPVPGELRMSDDDNVTLGVYPTDESLTYHLYYFGHVVTDRWFVPEVAARIPKGARALPLLRNLAACGLDSGCRVFNSLSAVVGEGRWDIDLGSGATVEFAAIEQTTGRPVADVAVALPRSPSVFFVEGKVFEHLHKTNFMPNVVTTGRTGRVRVRWPGTEKARYGAGKRGYADVHGEFQPLPGETVTVEIPLQPEDSQEDGVRVRLRHGEPVPQAFFLVVDKTGARQSCSRAGSLDGFVSFPPDCLTGRKVVVIHPAVALQLLDGDALRAAAEVSVEPAPSRPASVLVADGEGRPIRDVAFELRFPELTLTLNDFYFASSLSSQPLGLGRSSSEGVVVLSTVDPEVWGPVEALLVLGGTESATEVERGARSVLSVF